MAKTTVSTQAWCPILEIMPDGVILTKDHRFVMILEFTPINFLLRNADDRDKIVNSFAQLIRTLPSNVQIKVVTRKSNTDRYIKQIEKDMANEAYSTVRMMQQEHIDLVRDEAARGSTHHFYVVYEYSRTDYRKPKYEEIHAAMMQMKARICTGLRECGNDLVQPEGVEPGELQMSHLYNILSRRKSEQETYQEHRDAVFADFLSEHGMSDNILIPVSNLLAPDVINASFSRKEICVDGLYYSFLYVDGNTLPDYIPGGWMNCIIDAPGGIDVDMFFKKMPADKIMTRLELLQNVNVSNASNAQRSNRKYYELIETAEAGEELRMGMSGGEDFCYFGVLVTVTGRSRSELNARVKDLRSYFKAKKMDLKCCQFRQLEAFRSSLPLCCCDPQIFKQMRRNALSNALASAYPFVSYELNDDSGTFLGTNNENGSLISINFFDRSKYPNGNGVLLGATGMGKSFALKSIATRMRQKHIPTYIITPEAGEEFGMIAETVGGQHIRFGGGSPDNIPIMEIRRSDRTAWQRAFGNASEKDSLLTEKLEQLQIFFQLAIPDMTNTDMQILDACLLAAYEEKGITPKNRSLIDPKNPDKYKPMPTLADVQRILRNYEDGRGAHLAEQLNSFVQPGAPMAWMNKPSTVDVNSDFLVVDVTKLPERAMPMGMFIALDLIWQKVKEDPTRHKVVLIDEIWKLLGSQAPAVCRNFVKKIWKTIRHYGGIVIGSTQNLNGLFASRDDASDIVNNSQFNMFLGNKKSEIAQLQEFFGLTGTECDIITSFKKGELLLCAGNARCQMFFTATERERLLFATNPMDLKRRAAQGIT